MPLAQPAALLSQQMPRVAVVSERVVVVVMLDLSLDGAGTVASGLAARNSYVLGVGLLNAQSRVLWFQ